VGEAAAPLDFQLFSLPPPQQQPSECRIFVYNSNCNLIAGKLRNSIKLAQHANQASPSDRQVDETFKDRDELAYQLLDY
jgi:hypothetical protein